jgi:hypothetical protein
VVSGGVGIAMQIVIMIINDHWDARALQHAHNRQVFEDTCPQLQMRSSKVLASERQAANAQTLTAHHNLDGPPQPRTTTLPNAQQRQAVDPNRANDASVHRSTCSTVGRGGGCLSQGTFKTVL